MAQKNAVINCEEEYTMNKNLPHTDDLLEIELADSTKASISVQAYQAIYREITGKSEKITEYYKDPFQIGIDELIQVHKKISQAFSSYERLEFNHSVTVEHRGDATITLSHLEQYDTTINKPVESVLLKYNVSLKPPNLPERLLKPQSYILSIKFVSGLTVVSDIKKAAEELFGEIGMLFNFYTAKVQIEYADYLVGKSIMHIIDESIKGFKTSKPGSLLKFSLNHSKFLRICIKYLPFLTFLYLLWQYAPHYFSINNSLLALTKFILGGFALLFFFYKIGDYFGTKTRIALAHLDKLSYIKLNCGDNNLIQNCEKKDKFAALKILFTLSVELIISIAGIIIEKLIT